MYLYIESIGNGVKNTKAPYYSYTDHPSPLCVCDFFAGGDV